MDCGWRWRPSEKKAERFSRPTLALLLSESYLIFSAQSLEGFKGWIAVVAHPNPALPGTQSISRCVAENPIGIDAVTCTIQQVLQLTNLLRAEVSILDPRFPSVLPAIFPYFLPDFSFSPP